MEVLSRRSPTKADELLKSSIAARRKSQTELSNLTKLLAEKSARQAALETTGDLHNAAVLAELGRLQIFTALLPRRIAAQEQDDLKAEQSLTEATNQFIQGNDLPRVFSGWPLRPGQLLRANCPPITATRRPESLPFANRNAFGPTRAWPGRHPWPRLAAPSPTPKAPSNPGQTRTNLKIKPSQPSARWPFGGARLPASL